MKDFAREVCAARSADRTCAAFRKSLDVFVGLPQIIGFSLRHLEYPLFTAISIGLRMLGF